MGVPCCRLLRCEAESRRAHGSATALCLGEKATSSRRLPASRATTAATTRISAATARLRLGDVDLEVAAAEGLVVQGGDCRIGVLHFDEGEAARLARVAIGDDLR